jgi:hypothetical protein
MRSVCGMQECGQAGKSKYLNSVALDSTVHTIVKVMSWREAARAATSYVRCYITGACPVVENGQQQCILCFMK